MVFKNLNFDSMLYLLTIFVDSQDHSIYKSITIFLISFFFINGVMIMGDKYKECGLKSIYLVLK